MKSLMIKIKERFFCNHDYEPVYFDEERMSGIRYYVCRKCGKVIYSTRK